MGLIGNRTLAAVTSAALALTGLAPVAGWAAAGDKTLTGGFDVGPGGFPGNFNPLMATTGYMALTLNYQPLFVYDGKLSQIVGQLAKSYTVSDDKKTYTITLQPDVKWQDGTPFTSADVAFTLKLAQDKTSGSVYVDRLSAITDVETPDAHTVVLKLSKVNLSLLDTLTKLMMLPKHKLEKIDPSTLPRNPYWTDHPIATGPFVFDKYVTDQYVEYSRFKEYWRGEPKIARVVNRYFKTTAGAVSALKSGEIQISYVNADDLSAFKGDKGFHVIKGNSFVVNYLGFNFGAKIWDNQKVRQAVMYAINRKAIVDSLYGGMAKVANCGYVVDRYVPKGLNDYAYDPEKARQLLKEAGWDKINGSKPIKVLTYYNTQLSDNVLGAMQAMLSQVGINIVPRDVDMSTYNATIYATTPDYDSFGLVYAGLTNGPDPSNLNIGLNASQIPPNGSNYTRVNLPGVSKAFDTALSDADGSKYDSDFQNVCKAMNTDLPWATLWVTDRFGVASAKLKDFVWMPAPGGGPYASHPEKWDIAN
ncbi:ABC transporter substrate-binding protein [Acidimangrovimonas sediminis]|uniref:ABC transporter substrate-binding protein n=1 Tax=Acidimangrovimonas sediminis TaxID=2056283 RepID=UPI000C7F9629|nr:ABC transporter substrate-binding protein [Acidimangrovimonas sediminis]